MVMKDAAPRATRRRRAGARACDDALLRERGVG